MSDTRIRARKLTGVREWRLIQDCALDELDNAELAEKYEVEKHTIENFKDRKRNEITAAAKEQTDKLAGIWVVKKEARLVAYQAEIERCLKLIEDIETESEMVAASLELPAPPDTTKITQLQANIFRALAAVAEQTGQLPTRTNENANGKGYRYTVLWDDEAAA